MRVTLRKSVELGGLNVLTAIAAHIPCCGSQILLSVFGLQVLGALSSTYFYKLQFLIPLLVTSVLGVGYGIYFLMRQRVISHHEHSQWGHVGEFLIVNLVIGYLVVGALYLFVPPHDHHIIDAHVLGDVSQDNKNVLVQYRDVRRSWPWTHRTFMAVLDGQQNNPLPVHEVYWYQAKPSNLHATKAAFHLYARPAAFWFLGASQNISKAKKPLDIFVVAEEQDVNQSKLLANLDPPSLVLFYSASCPPCLAEVKMLPDLVKEASPWKVIVATITKPDTTLIRATKDLQVRILDLSDRGGVDILRSFNNSQIALPFSFATDRNGMICIKHQGLVGTDMIGDWAKQCLI